MSESIARSRCSAVRPLRADGVEGERPGSGIPQCLQHRTAACRSLPFVARLPATVVAGVGVAGRPPRAAIGERALLASRRAGRADRRAEFHRRSVHEGRGRRVQRKYRRHRREVPPRGRPGLRSPIDCAGQHPARVRVDDRMPVAVREDGDRPRRVVPDSGERQQGVDVPRDNARVAIRGSRRRHGAATAPGAGSRGSPTVGRPQRAGPRPARTVPATARATPRGAGSRGSQASAGA